MKPPQVVLVVGPPSPSDPDRAIHLFREDGTPAGTIKLPQNANSWAAAADRVLVVTADGSLYAFHADGSSQLVSQLGPNATSFMVSPDGQQWIWITVVVSQSQTIHLGGIGQTPRVLATVNYPTFLGPYAWTHSGIYLTSSPMDYFGYVPFPNAWAAFGGLRRMNPKDGLIEVLPSFIHCIFSDEAQDGTIACFPTKSAYLTPVLHSLRIIKPGDKSTDLSLATPRFNFVGDAYFSPDGSMLTVAGATGTADTTPAMMAGTSPNPKPEQFGTDLVQVADASIARFGPDGVRPAMGRQSWLPDGKVVLWRPAGAAGGPPGLYVLDPKGNGQANEILIAGTPIGYLTTSG